MIIFFNVIIFSLVDLLDPVQSQTRQFNIFKNYGNAKVRPVQYAKVSRKHAIGEYLDATQLKMLKYRKGPDSPNILFTDQGWNGNKKDNTNTGETRRLAGGINSIYVAGDMSNLPYISVPDSFAIAIILVAVISVLLLSLAIVRSRMRKFLMRRQECLQCAEEASV